MTLEPRRYIRPLCKEREHFVMELVQEDPIVWQCGTCRWLWYPGAATDGDSGQVRASAAHPESGSVRPRPEL